MRKRLKLYPLWAIYYRGLIILQKRMMKNLISFFLSPLLYAFAFGWGVGRNLEIEGTSYLTFMIPGLIAMAGMNQSFSIAAEINYSRFLNRFFEEYLLSPADNWIVVLGNVLYGMTKGICSFFALLIIALIFGAGPAHPMRLLPVVLLNTFMFSSLGVWIALFVKNHRDLNSFSSFVMVPMAFLAGTFFSLEHMPGFFSLLARMIPLTHASLSLRSIYLGRPLGLYHLVVMAGFALFFFFMAVGRVRRAVQ
jgi:ABC-2 type transport system permease protein